MRKYIFVSIFTLTVLGSIAQSVKPISDAIHISYEKKIIYPQELNFPENTTAFTVLCLLPELFSRPSDTEFSNYEIKIDGISTENLRNLALMNIKIHEIKCIEIKESPTASYTKNGEAGTIDIKLKDAKEKPQGSIELSGNYPFQALPSGLFLIQKKKLEIKVLASANYVAPHDKNTETDTYANATGIMFDHNVAKNDMNRWDEVIRTYLNYRPTERDLFQFRISEQYSHDLNKKFETPYLLEEYQVSSSYNNNFRILGNTEYIHNFKNRSILDIEVNYNFSPLSQGYDDDKRSLSYTNNKHTLGGKAEYAFHLLPQKNKNTLLMYVGSNYNMEFSEDVSDDDNKYRDLDFTVDGSYINISPYLQLEGAFNNFTFKAIGEYQFYDYNTTRNSRNETSVNKNNFTGIFMAGWKFTPKHRLRLILNRKLNAPNQKQLYPFLAYSSSANGFVKGNPDLEPSETNEAKLEYISGLEWAKSSMMIDASVSYLFTGNIIKAKEGKPLLGFPYTYSTFINEGDKYAINTNFILSYRVGKSTTALTTNIYFNREERENEEADHYNYANFSLISSYNFNKGWDISGRLNYYGNIDTKNGKLGNCLMIDLSGGKTWDKWSLMGFLTLPLTGKSRNTIQGEVDTQYVRYFLVEPSFGMNIRYQF